MDLAPAYEISLGGGVELGVVVSAHPRVLPREGAAAQGTYIGRDQAATGGASLRQTPSSNRIKPLQSRYQPCSQRSATMTAAVASALLRSGHAGECEQLTWLTSRRNRALLSTTSEVARGHASFDGEWT